MRGMTRIPVSKFFTTIIGSLNERLREYCKETGSHFLHGVYDAVENPKKSFTLIPEITRDGAHFNFQGYEIMGRAVVAGLNDVVKPGWKVLLVGDSITAGFPEYEPLLLGRNYGDEKHSYGYYLRTMLDCDVENCGLSGDLTSSMASRISQHLQWDPDLAILQGGANDAYYSAETRTGVVTQERALEMTESIYGNFKSMIKDCMEKGAERAIIPMLPFYDSALIPEAWSLE